MKGGSRIGRRLGSWQTVRLGWGLLDQAISSATNFFLFIIVGRELGPRGLGPVAVGFSAYVLALVLHRAVLTEALVVRSSSLEPAERRLASRSTLAVYISTAALTSVCFMALGAWLPGAVGRGLLLFGPWILPALLQDFWRFIFFRDSDGRAALVNDGLWAAGMAVTAPIALGVGSDVALVAIWGVGATVGALAGFVQSGMKPWEATAGAGWWRKHGWPLGRWLLLDRAAAAAGTQGAILLLSFILTAAQLGGLRAAQSIFAPLTLLGPALSLPGLPALTRSLAKSPQAGRSLAIRLSLIITVLAFAYLLILVATGHWILPLLFGGSFRPFGNLLLPLGIGQILAAAGTGFFLLLKAGGKASLLVLARALGSMGSLIFVWVLAMSGGATGAAWGLAIGGGVDSALATLFGVRQSVFVTRESPGPVIH